MHVIICDGEGVFVFIAYEGERCAVFVGIDHVLSKLFFLTVAEGLFVFAQRLSGNEGVGVAEVEIAPVTADIVAGGVERLLLCIAAENGIIGSADSNGLVGAFDARFGRDIEVNLQVVLFIVLGGDLVANVGDGTGSENQIIKKDGGCEGELHFYKLVFECVDRGCGVYGTACLRKNGYALIVVSVRTCGSSDEEHIVAVKAKDTRHSHASACPVASRIVSEIGGKGPEGKVRIDCGKRHSAGTESSVFHVASPFRFIYLESKTPVRLHYNIGVFFCQ